MSDDIVPAVGQVWQDNDPRVVNRFVRITAIQDGKAACTTWYAGLEGSARRVRIGLSRFRPTSNGYRFVRDDGSRS